MGLPGRGRRVRVERNPQPIETPDPGPVETPDPAPAPQPKPAEPVPAGG